MECNHYCTQNSSQATGTAAKSGFLCSSLAIGIETVVMEMVPNNFHWLNGTIFELCGGKKVCTGLGMPNLMSWTREWRSPKRRLKSDGTPNHLVRHKWGMQFIAYQRYHSSRTCTRTSSSSKNSTINIRFKPPFPLQKATQILQMMELYEGHFFIWRVYKTNRYRNI
jgi:hypothetical protein